MKLDKDNLFGEDEFGYAKGTKHYMPWVGVGMGIGWGSIVSSGIQLDTFVTPSTNGASPVNVSITIGNNNNRMLLCFIGYANNINTINSVKIGTTSLTLITSFTEVNFVTAVYQLTQANGLGTGSQTVSVTVTGTPSNEFGVGLVSLYNVNQTTPTGVTAGNGANPSSSPSVSITPTTVGSWIFAQSYTDTHDYSSPSNTQLWDAVADNVFHVAQYNNKPTIGSSNTLSWTNTSVKWSCLAFEVLTS